MIKKDKNVSIGICIWIAAFFVARQLGMWETPLQFGLIIWIMGVLNEN